MGQRDGNGDGDGAKVQRDQTDESLRVERDKAADGLTTKGDALERQADEVLQRARDRTDEVVRNARDKGEKKDERRERPMTTAENAERERTQADAALQQERSTADARLEVERSERRRYLADFLASEREATDKDLTGERAHTDKVIAARDEFLATVSHDLRSLLGGLSLNAALMVTLAPEGAVGEKMHKHAATSQRLIMQMNRLVNDLLDITSIDAGQLALVPEEVDVMSLLQETLEAFEPIAAAKRITLDADAGARTLRARLDSGRILQVLANLVSNAIKFTPMGGHVSIRIHTEENALHFSVSDTGIGIADNALEAVFERFRQMSVDRRGLGLGLHISKRIVEAHGGKMWAESKLTAGSTFHFSLPASLLSAPFPPSTTPPRSW